MRVLLAKVWVLPRLLHVLTSVLLLLQAPGCMRTLVQMHQRLHKGWVLGRLQVQVQGLCRLEGTTPPLKACCQKWILAPAQNT